MPLHEYADEVLFQPLGITSAQWELAPEGVQSGDGLYLAPYDMARIGYLYLNEGEWNGQRIVSADWVERSTQPDVNEDYGYMWWIFDGYFLAAGHRGQLILVAPELDMVIVTTSEFDIFPIIGPMEEFLFPFVQTNEQLPENPSEAERLATEVQQFTAPQAEELAAVPDTQNLVDGQRYVFEPNDLNWDAMTLTFSETEAIFTLETATTVETFNVGLDGIARINLTNNPQRFLSNTPVAMNGEWTRETTFIIDARYLDGRDFWTYSMRFGDNVRINARENILSGIIDSRFVIEGDTQD
jgi:hypothetical protein